jgi:hypothetical protein
MPNRRTREQHPVVTIERLEGTGRGEIVVARSPDGGTYRTPGYRPIADDGLGVAAGVWSGLL